MILCRRLKKRKKISGSTAGDFSSIWKPRPNGQRVQLARDLNWLIWTGRRNQPIKLGHTHGNQLGDEPPISSFQRLNDQIECQSWRDNPLYKWRHKSVSLRRLPLKGEVLHGKAVIKIQDLNSSDMLLLGWHQITHQPTVRIMVLNLIPFFFRPNSQCGGEPGMFLKFLCWCFISIFFLSFLQKTVGPAMLPIILKKAKKKKHKLSVALVEPPKVQLMLISFPVNSVIAILVFKKAILTCNAAFCFRVSEKPTQNPNFFCLHSPKNTFFLPPLPHRLKMSDHINPIFRAVAQAPEQDNFQPLAPPPEMEYQSQQDLYDAAQSWAKDHGYAIIITHSSTSNGENRFTYQCDKSGS
ncbi:hypothetical protein VP01_1915g1, partial [Puccinia sorghi]